MSVRNIWSIWIYERYFHLFLVMISINGVRSGAQSGVRLINRKRFSVCSRLFSVSAEGHNINITTSITTKQKRRIFYLILSVFLDDGGQSRSSSSLWLSLRKTKKNTHKISSCVLKAGRITMRFSHSRLAMDLDEATMNI